MIGFIFLGLGLLKILKRKRKKVELSKKEIESAFKTIESIYGTEKAQLLEKLFRWETAHFQSGAFKKTYSAGMEATKTTFPYGWTSLSSYWKIQPDSAPLKEFVKMTDSGGRKVNFLQFKTFLGALKTVAKVLENRNWNLGAWYSSIPEQQQNYTAKVMQVKNRFV